MGVTLDSINLDGCLGDNEIELFLLQGYFLEQKQKERINQHLSVCSACFRRYIELRMFHDILFSELRKPISNRVRNLVKGLQNQHQE